MVAGFFPLAFFGKLGALDKKLARGRDITWGLGEGTLKWRLEGEEEEEGRGIKCVILSNSMELETAMGFGYWLARHARSVAGFIFGAEFSPTKN